MLQQYYYIKFIIQLTFISNGFWLVDFFHRGQTWVLQKLHERKESDSEVKTPFRDDYQFDLGYHQSYSIVVMLNCLIFCPLVPLISFFAFFFFFIKYHVDKYNLVFVYYKVFESGGKIRKNVTNFMLFTLVFVLLITVSFFSIEFNSEVYFFGGVIMIIVWVIIYYYTKQ